MIQLLWKLPSRGQLFHLPYVGSVRVLAPVLGLMLALERVPVVVPVPAWVLEWVPEWECTLPEQDRTQ